MVLILLQFWIKILTELCILPLWSSISWYYSVALVFLCSSNMLENPSWFLIHGVTVVLLWRIVIVGYFHISITAAMYLSINHLFLTSYAFWVTWILFIPIVLASNKINFMGCSFVESLWGWYSSHNIRWIFQVIPGMEAAVKSMRVGGLRRVIIPPSQGYQNTSQEPIPPNVIPVVSVLYIVISCRWWSTKVSPVWPTPNHCSLLHAQYI